MVWLLLLGRCISGRCPLFFFMMLVCSLNIWGVKSDACESVDTVRVQLQWIIQSQFGGFLAADASNYYLDSCLYVLLLPGGATIVESELVQRRAHFGVGWVDRQLRNKFVGAVDFDGEFRKFNVTRIAQHYTRSGMVMISWKDSGIVTPEDWAGRVVGYWPSGNHYRIVVAANKAGLSLCYECPNAGGYIPCCEDGDPGVTADFVMREQWFEVASFVSRDGNFDVVSAMIYNEYGQILETYGDDGTLLPQEDFNVFDFNAYGADIQEDGIMVDDKWIEEPGNYDIAVRFVVATLRGWIFCRDHPKDCVNLLADKGYHQQWQMAEVNKQVWPAPQGVGNMSVVSSQANADRAYHAGVMDFPVQADQFSRTDIVQDALAILQSEYGLDVYGESFVPVTNEFCPTVSGGIEICQPCPAGSRFDPVTRFCVLCREGTANAATGQEICQPCEAMHFSETGAEECTECNELYVAFSEAAAQQCLSQVECEIGTIQNGLNCDPCLEGTFFKESTGVCNECAPGFYQDEPGRFSCKPCEEGNYSEGAAPLCTPCPPGFYSDEDEATECLLCDQFSYNPGDGASACLPCPPNSEAPYRAATSVLECGCRPGFYFSGDRSECLACMEGAVCEGGEAVPLPAAGYWASASDPLTMFLCVDYDSCLGMGYSSCSSHYIGTVCSRCADGYFMSNRECGRCSSSSEGLGVLFVLLLLTFSVLIYHFVNSANLAQARAALGVSSSLGLAVSTAQVFLVFKGFSLDWPDEVKDMMNALSVVNFNVDLFQFECGVSEFSFATRLAFKLSLPLILLAVFGFVYLASFAYPPFAKMVTAWTTVTSPASSTDTDGTGRSKDKKKKFSGLRLWLRMAPPPHPQPTPMQFDLLCNAYGQCVELMFIFMVLTSLSMFECYEQPNGDRSLMSDPSIRCDSDEWLELLPFALFGILLYCCGTFISFGYALFKAPSKSDDMRFQRRFAFLVSRFRADKWWWTLMLLLRKLFLAGLTSFAADDAVTQIAVSIVFLVVCLSVHMFNWPFFMESLNYLDAFLMITHISVLLCALSIVVSEAGGGRASTSLSYFVIFLMWNALLCCVGVAVLETLATRRASRQKREEEKGAKRQTPAVVKEFEKTFDPLLGSHALVVWHAESSAYEHALMDKLLHSVGGVLRGVGVAVSADAVSGGSVGPEGAPTTSYSPTSGSRKRISFAVGNKRVPGQEISARRESVEDRRQRMGGRVGSPPSTATTSSPPPPPPSLVLAPTDLQAVVPLIEDEEEEKSPPPPELEATEG